MSQVAARETPTKLAADEVCEQFLASACHHLSEVTRLAEGSRVTRPGLAAMLDASAQRFAGQVLDLIQSWPS